MTFFKVEAGFHRNPKIGRLSNGQFRAYVTILSEAKLATPQGTWPSLDHLTYLLGESLSEEVDGLISLRLLEVDDVGRVSVHDWSDHQSDPTAAQRKRDQRDRDRASVTDVTRDHRDVTQVTLETRQDETRQDKKRSEESAERRTLRPNGRDLYDDQLNESFRRMGLPVPERLS